MPFKSNVLYAALLATASISLSSQAQESKKTNEEAQSQDAKRLKAVVVTAQKREQSVQSVPLAIAVIGGDQVLERGLSSSNDVQRLAPGLSGQQSGFSRPRWFIRGIGSNDPNLTTESPLGVYNDEVFTALTSLQSFPIFDLERVEVLRGPQGTLWGKNTTAGAVNYISRRPDFATSGYVRASLGDWGAKAIQGGLGGAINEHTAGRIAFYHNSYDGYARNLATGNDGPGFEENALRVQWLTNVTDTFNALVKVHLHKREPGGGYSYQVHSEPGGADRFGFTPAYGTNPKAGDDYYAGESEDITNTEGALVKLNWALGGATLTSISSYDESEGHSKSFSGHPPTYTGTRDTTSGRGEDYSRQASQEVRLVSPQDGPLTWIGGLHFFRYSFVQDSASATFAPSTRSNYSRTWRGQDAESYAVFGSVKYEFTDSFRLNAGLRWTDEDKDITIHTVRTPTGATTFNNVSSWWNTAALNTAFNYDEAVSAADSWNEVTGDITPEWQINRDALAYFRYARGYRSGGFGASIPTLNSAQIAAGVVPYIPVVEPEYLDAYELGLKSTWLDGTLNINSAVFYYDHKDIQLNVQAPNPLNLINPPSGSFSQNASQGEIKGLELEAHWVPTANLQLRAAYSLVDARYVDFYPLLSVSGVTQTVDRSGNRYFRTPKHQFSVDAQYRIPTDSAGTYILSTDWVYRSHQYYDAARQGAAQGEVARALDGNVYQREWQEQGAYWIGNARAAYLTRDERIEYFIEVQNAADENYVVNATAASPSYPVSLGTPRFVQVGVITRF